MALRLSLAICALIAALLSIAAVPQTVLLTLPHFTLPPGATSTSGGSWGPVDGLPSRATPPPRPPTAAELQQQYSVGYVPRLTTTGTVSGTVAHYGQQLSALGWKSTLTTNQPSLGFVRYSVDSADGPLMGSLLVMPFPELKNQFVGIRLVRSRVPWPTGGRTGGGGGASTPKTPPRYVMSLLDFTDSEIPFPKSVELPWSISRLDSKGGSGSVDYSVQEVRFQTFESPAAIMKDFEPQIAKSGWTADIRGGDKLQAFALFRPPAGGDSVALLVLTTIPGANGVDFALWVIRNRR